MPIFEKKDPLELKIVISINIATIAIAAILGFIVRGSWMLMWSYALIYWYLLTKPLLQKKSWSFWTNVCLLMINMFWAIYQTIIQARLVELTNMILPLVVIGLLLSPKVRKIFVKE